MALYEHVFIVRQDASKAQAERLIEEFSRIVSDNGGSIAATEYWGLRTLSYKINKNRKGHYCFIKTDAPSFAVFEAERLIRRNEDVLRFMTVPVDFHDEGPSQFVSQETGRLRRDIDSANRSIRRSIKEIRNRHIH